MPWLVRLVRLEGQPRPGCRGAEVAPRGRDEEGGTLLCTYTCLCVVSYLYISTAAGGYYGTVAAVTVYADTLTCLGLKLPQRGRGCVVAAGGQPF